MSLRRAEGTSVAIVETPPPSIATSPGEWEPVHLSQRHAFLRRDRFITLCGAVAEEHALHPDEPWLRPELITAQMAEDNEAELVSADRQGNRFTMWWRLETSAGTEQWAALCIPAKILIRFGLLGLIEHTPV
jgi:hypothetical protein